MWITIAPFVTPRACRPRRARTKGKVERMVKVTGSFKPSGLFPPALQK
ncbi:hypothetical protein ECDEC2C_5536 [Escherichia coli DEC2C]|nr:hypothetical protein ECDEC2C_5536 [Escherichia coli DEC2C]EHU47897.1 hypothetical protein ECDEC2E_5325 [Escherichia coli DEC2E]